MPSASGAIGRGGGVSFGRERDLERRRNLPAVTRDGQEVVLMANVDVNTEVQAALDHGARGVGMYRTEFLYLNYRLPSEDEQFKVYSALVESLVPHPVVIRTMDLGGDKLSHVLEVPPEANPFLGWRGIRICLDTPDLFKTQLRALLRAGVHGEAQILLPMISSLNESTAHPGASGGSQRRTAGGGATLC